jgi:hypothetical protein
VKESDEIRSKKSKHEHEIYDLRLTKLEIDCRNGHIINTHLFHIQIMLNQNMVVLIRKVGKGGKEE